MKKLTLSILIALVATAGGGESSVRLWDFASGKELRRINASSTWFGTDDSVGGVVSCTVMIVSFSVKLPAVSIAIVRIAVVPMGTGTSVGRLVAMFASVQTRV